MPTGIRGIVLAGVFATTMGSLSAALNALATSATNDWYIPYAGKRQTEANHLTAARVFTGIFAILMIIIAVAFAYAKVKNPDVRILPVVLGIAGFILGPMLGVFLLGMLTHRRGSDNGNMIAISVGLILTIFLGGLHVVFLDLIAPTWHVTRALDAWQKDHVTVSFTWFALVGALSVVLVGVIFPTPAAALQRAIRQGEMADEGQDSPVHLRR
jgi:Na+/proline symporter